MGWLEKAQAAAKIAAAEAARLGEAAKEKLEASDTDCEATAQNKQLVQSLLAKGRVGLDVARELTTEIIEEAGQTDTGQRVGEGVRELSRAVAKLPGIGTLGDALRAHHGIPELVEQLRSRPLDPVCNVQLAEAMARFSSDLRRAEMTMGVVHPLLAAAQQGVKQVAKIGAEESDPLQVALLKRSFALGTRRLESSDQHTQVVSIAAISRVYVAVGLSAEARAVAQLGHRLFPSEYEWHFVMTQAALAESDSVGATEAAIRSIESGCSLGHLVLADLVAEQTEMSFRERLAAATEHRQQIVQSDHVHYFGFARDPKQAAFATVEEQISKATTIKRKLQGDV